MKSRQRLETAPAKRASYPLHAPRDDLFGFVHMNFEAPLAQVHLARGIILTAIDRVEFHIPLRYMEASLRRMRLLGVTVGALALYVD